MLISLLCTKSSFFVLRYVCTWEEDGPILYRAELVKVSAEQNDWNPSKILVATTELVELLVDGE